MDVLLLRNRHAAPCGIPACLLQLSRCHFHGWAGWAGVAPSPAAVVVHSFRPFKVAGDSFCVNYPSFYTQNPWNRVQNSLCTYWIPQGKCIEAKVMNDDVLS